MNIRTVTVLGANGTMGQNVAGIFASFGNAKVYMVARSLQDAKDAKMKAAKSVKAEAIEKNLIPKTYDDLEECISDSDLIFESVAEIFEVKQKIYKMISKFIKPNTIIGTGTSGLSINGLSTSFSDDIRKNYMGIHMYNPPYNMTLCEVIPSKKTNGELVAKMKDYLSGVLFRDVVEVKDEPAFMGNRIGFQFINEALQYAELYKENGGIDYIDAILSGFTGRSMSPLVTSDFVGLDIHKAIIGNIYQNTKDYAHETFVMPSFAEELIKQNKLGRKTGVGLYRMVTDNSGEKTIEVYDVLNGNYRKKRKYQFPFAEKMKSKLREGNYTGAFADLTGDNSTESMICVQFLIKYVIYSLVTTASIGEDIHSSDHVMATGFNWVPPLALIEAFGGKETFHQLVKTRMSNEYLEKLDFDVLFNTVTESSYDYRPFFKAK